MKDNDKLVWYYGCINGYSIKTCYIATKQLYINGNIFGIVNYDSTLVFISLDVGVEFVIYKFQVN